MTPEVWRARRRYAFDAAVVALMCAGFGVGVGYTLGDRDGREAARRERIDVPASDASTLTWSGAEQVPPFATLTIGEDLSARGAGCNVEIRDGRGNVIGTTLAACSPWGADTITISNFTPAGKR